MPTATPTAATPTGPTPAVETAQPTRRHAVAGEEEFARNLVAGRWQFPAAPYEFEIRSPLSSEVLCCVPLSSRFDVDAAVRAAAAAAPAWAADPGLRRLTLTRTVAAMERHASRLAARVADETGQDAQAAAAQVRTAVTWMRAWLTRDTLHALDATTDPTPGRGPDGDPPGVAGVVLGWGAPFLEAVAALVPTLLAGHTVVVKPSLRAPLSAVLLAHLLQRSDLPAGVLDVVQGTGTDVGAALAGHRGLAVLHVRGGRRTLELSRRAAASTGADLRPLRGGGNVLVAGADAAPEQVAAAAVSGLRQHAGPAALPLLVVHASTAGSVVDAVVSAVRDQQAPPLATQPLRDRAVGTVRAMEAAGARVLCGGRVPDDARHRMGWIMPATVLSIGAIANGIGPRSAHDPFGEPLGPVLAVATWRAPHDLDGTFARPRFTDGITWTTRVDDDVLTVLRRRPARTLDLPRHPDRPLPADALPPAWTAGLRPGGGSSHDDDEAGL